VYFFTMHLHVERDDKVVLYDHSTKTEGHRVIVAIA